MVKKKILVLGIYQNAQYHPLSRVDGRLQEILKDYDLVFTDKPSDLLRCSAYDGAISYWDDWKEPVKEEETDALIRYVEAGGALLVLHNGISLQLQENFVKLVGAKFLTHPTQEVISFVPLEDEITKACSSFDLLEEPYQYEMVADNKKLILKYVYRGKDYPAGWKKTAGDGRLVFLTPGHTYEKFDSKEYGELIRNSMKWCLREADQQI